MKTGVQGKGPRVAVVNLDSEVDGQFFNGTIPVKMAGKHGNERGLMLHLSALEHITLCKACWVGIFHQSVNKC